MTNSLTSSWFYSYTQWPGIVLVLTGCSGRVSPARSPLSCSGMRSSRLPAVSHPPRWRSGSTGPGIAAGSTSPSPHEVSYKKSIEISTDQATVVCFVACFTHVCIYWHFSLASRILCSYSYMTVRHSTYWHFSLASRTLCSYSYMTVRHSTYWTFLPGL